MPNTDVTVTNILPNIKKLVGITNNDTSFDTDIITSINTAFFTLCQLGVGPSTPFSISGNSEEWTDFTVDIDKLQGVKNYVYFKTRLAFDPPTSSFVLESIKEQIRELEFRLNIAADIPVIEKTT